MKKILSLILALSLIISVAPMSFAEDVAEEPIDEPGMYFNFNAKAFGKETDIPKADIQTIDTNNEFARIGTDPWYMDGHYALNDYRITSADPDVTNYPESKPEALYWKLTSYSYLSEATSSGKPTGNAGSALVLRVTLNESGTFTPSIKYEAGPTGSNYLFLLAPVSTYTSDYGHASPYVANRGALKQYFNTPNSALIKIGEQNLYAAESSKEPAVFDPVTIKAGEYYLFLVPNGRINGLPGKTGPYYMNLYSLHFTPTTAEEFADKSFTATQDTTYTEAPATATVSRLALYGDTDETIGTEEVAYGSTATINEVPATVTRDDGTYNFLYWAKGLEEGASKQILSTSNRQFSYKPHEGANYLIAVYEKEGAAKEAFYNYNGQLLTDLKIEGGLLPALPAMAGRGNATAWVQRGTNTEFAGGAVAPEDGDMVFMAKYDEPSEGNITINDNKYFYGDTIVCKNIVDNFNAETFSYWTRQIGDGEAEIVSIDADYSFSAYTDCTIEAVCKGAVSETDLGRVARKILLSTFSVGNQTAVMAEFIGFDGAKEKGIMFGDKKIAMTTDYAQFTVTNDTTSAVTVTGYAIVDDSGETVKYTDGSISVAGATTAAAE